MSAWKHLSRRVASASFFSVLTVALCLSVAGCERKEKIVDIEAPGVNVEVERNIDTGKVDVEATDN